MNIVLTAEELRTLRIAMRSRVSNRQYASAHEFEMERNLRDKLSDMLRDKGSGVDWPDSLSGLTDNSEVRPCDGDTALLLMPDGSVSSGVFYGTSSRDVGHWEVRVNNTRYPLWREPVKVHYIKKHHTE